MLETKEESCAWYRINFRMRHRCISACARSNEWASACVFLFHSFICSIHNFNCLVFVLLLIHQYAVLLTSLFVVCRFMYVNRVCAWIKSHMVFISASFFFLVFIWLIHISFVIFKLEMMHATLYKYFKLIFLFSDVAVLYNGGGGGGGLVEVRYVCEQVKCVKP